MAQKALFIDYLWGIETALSKKYTDEKDLGL